jgi:hypothetical protein
MLRLGLSALGALWLGAVEAPITDVTVYSDRTRVVRTARVTLSGSQRLELPLLQAPVDPASIRVEAQGAQVSHVDILPVEAKALPTTEARRLVTELERLDDQISQVRAEREAYTAQLTALGQLKPVAPPEDSEPESSAAKRPRMDSSGWGTSATFLVDATARLQAKLRDITRREEELQRTLTQRVAEARQLGTAPERPGLQVIPTVTGEGPATVTLSYVTAAARWYPLYEVRLEPASQRVLVSFSGRVSQESGEDWQEASLTLSTAWPSSAVALPRLATWKIGQRERFIPTPYSVPDSWRPPPPVPALPAREPHEDERLRGRLLSLINPSASAPATTEREVASERTQAQGVILGTLVDARTKRPLADAVVYANSPSLPEVMVVVTDSQGTYRIASLPAGTYSVRFEKESFKPFVRENIPLRNGQTARVNAALLPEDSFSEEIAITAQPPSVDVGSTSTGVNVDQEYVRRIEANKPGGRGGASRAPAAAPPAAQAGVSLSESVESAPREVSVAVGGLAPPVAWRQPAVDARLPAALAGGHVLTFTTPRRETVRSGGGERRVPLFSETWPVQVERRLFPALTPNAYLVAELRNPSKQVLPGGEAQLFVGADPAGSANLALVTPNAPFTLPLGVDPAVRPVRNVSLRSAEKGFIGKDELTEYLVTLEVANPYPVELAVRLQDQWPVSRSEKLEVKLLRVEPEATQDDVKGTLEWRLTVPASGKRTVSFLYSVRHPKGWRLQQNN